MFLLKISEGTVQRRRAKFLFLFFLLFFSFLFFFFLFFSFSPSSFNQPKTTQTSPTQWHVTAHSVAGLIMRHHNMRKHFSLAPEAPSSFLCQFLRQLHFAHRENQSCPRFPWCSHPSRIVLAQRECCSVMKRGKYSTKPPGFFFFFFGSFVVWGDWTCAQ